MSAEKLTSVYKNKFSDEKPYFITYDEDLNEVTVSETARMFEEYQYRWKDTLREEILVNFKSKNDKDKLTDKKLLKLIKDCANAETKILALRDKLAESYRKIFYPMTQEEIDSYISDNTADYKKLAVLGVGGEGEARIIETKNGNWCVMKTVKDAFTSQCNKETLSYILKVKHPLIIPVKKAAENEKGQLVLISPIMLNGDINDNMKAKIEAEQ